MQSYCHQLTSHHHQHHQSEEHKHLLAMIQSGSSRALSFQVLFGGVARSDNDSLLSNGRADILKQ
ncbi:hypothetical protein X798_01710 [Onchocerca flexuosa]|uniref:Uncharacterized protein n=1 Tax=Onchocerca flexuosa TaxID=387005 RepID=A0A238C1M5_9BILA|nr:hypothetical protein X798_01710 [Onchocerca flexuosa]